MIMQHGSAFPARERADLQFALLCESGSDTEAKVMMTVRATEGRCREQRGVTD